MGGRLKTILLTAVLTFSMFFGHTAYSQSSQFQQLLDAQARSMPNDIVELQEELQRMGLPGFCQAKVLILLGAFDSREGGATQQEFLELLTQKWETAKNPVPRITYVDMQRVVRDIFRVNGDGSWRRVNNEETIVEMTKREVQYCMIHNF